MYLFLSFNKQILYFLLLNKFVLIVMVNFTPLDQFIIHPLWNLKFIILNSTIIFFFLLILFFLFLQRSGFTKMYFLPSSFHFLLSNLYIFLNNLLVGQATKKSNVFFVFVSTLFLFILASNYLGMVPMGFTLTSHILITLVLGLSIISGLTIIGFIYQGIYFLKLFIPQDVNIVLVPLLIVIEVVSYISRGFSLSIRLFANLMSGHTLLSILSNFIFMLIKVNKVLMVLTFLVVFAIVILEIALAFLQAYVFTVLTSIYLNDSINGGSH